MKITIIKSVLFLFLLQASFGLQAKENQSQFKHGAKVHENHCLKCHTESHYTRENRIVKSINALGKQVRICRDQTDTIWFDEDTDAVINFLNKKYYRF